jgi:TM2 domain-containing membrane protein YozV
MATPKPPAMTTPPPPEHGVLAAVLSFLIPGLGQVLQGRIGKGLLFFVSVYALFFYGMYLGSGSITLNGYEYRVTGNVYLPNTAAKNNPWNLPAFLANLYNRPQYLGQFWVGIVAWPALYHYNFPGKTDKADPENGQAKGHTLWTEVANFEKTPSEEAVNAVHTSGDKLLELGWVYTVIAGVLNIMVIYDAYAGPAFPARKREEP